MPSLFRRAVAEALGTFGLVFIGTAVVLSDYFPKAGFNVLGIAIAHGLVLSIMVSCTMSISGGHLNPAVTVSLLTARRIEARSAGFYVLAQLLGAVFAVVLVKLLFPITVSRPTSLGTPAIASTISLVQAIGIEAVLTFFLVSAVFGTAVNPDAPKIGGFGIGLTLVFDILAGGPLTGAAMNPARAFAPALISGNWVGQIVWWVGPILGGVLAALLWDRVLLKKP